MWTSLAYECQNRETSCTQRFSMWMTDANKAVEAHGGEYERREHLAKVLEQCVKFADPSAEHPKSKYLQQTSGWTAVVSRLHIPDQ